MQAFDLTDTASLALKFYGSETSDAKKQFRLASYRTLSPEKEAALIRYLTMEGFLVSLWPEMKERIEEEAGWAFLV